MRSRRIYAAVLLLLSSSLACASQADDTTITIEDDTPGATVFISQLTLNASDTSVISRIQFTISPKPGSVTRPLSGSYSKDYLLSRGYEDDATGTIFLPVYGLYAGFANTVTLSYDFSDGSSKQDSTTITTAAFTNVCDLATPTVLQARVPDAYLSYDYYLVRGACSISPLILDTDGEVRWTSPLNVTSIRGGSSTFFDNAVYLTRNSQLFRVDLDGTVTLIADYASLGYIGFHHNIDRGKSGMVLDVDTDDLVESVNIEVDGTGNILKTWNLAEIISAAMVAGGDDPSLFVSPAPVDWFHNNSTAYKRSDKSLIVSSRENFVIALDYETETIKWILGDETKQWFLFPSLAQYALALDSGGVAPIGQHAVSITLDNNLLLMDNGRNSEFHDPPGINLPFSLPRKYRIDQAADQATELLDYSGDERLFSDFCGSVYEDAKNNYLVDYAYINAGTLTQILGYNAAGVKVFGYEYTADSGCLTTYNSLPLHLESTRFPTVGPQTLNISTRATVGDGDDALIEGFIITGSTPKPVVLRAIGPSLEDTGVAGALADPILSLYDSTGALVTTNDNWQDDGDQAAAIIAARLAPSDPSEAATLQTLAPGAYTVVIRGKGLTTGVALVEAYDLLPQPDSILANVSARAAVGTGDDVLITGFIVGEVGSTTTIIRAIGPSLTSVLPQSLSDPTLTVFDSNGLEIASNNNWQEDANAADLQLNSLAPPHAAESALLLNLPAGSYTGIVTGVGGGTGTGLVEVYDLQ